MERLNHELPDSTTIRELCEEYKRNNVITKEEYEHNRVKRGLRNADGTGVMAGLTHVCNVHGYLIADGDKIPDKGELTYRGINIEDIVRGCDAEDRFGFEEVAWLLIFGHLPTRSQYEGFSRLLFENRELPEYFPEDMIIKAPSKNIMNKLARSVLALYSYDDSPDDLSLENNMRQSISLIARMPSIMSYAYQVKRRHFDRESMFFHPYEPDHATAEAILNALRPDRKFTHQEAKLLDLLMVLHAEHGGGNNSTFTTRVLTSAGTDMYSAIGAAVGSLKGFKHGGANHQVRMMMDDLMAHVERLGRRGRGGGLPGENPAGRGRRRQRAHLRHGPRHLHAVGPPGGHLEGAGPGPGGGEGLWGEAAALRNWWSGCPRRPSAR